MTKKIAIVASLVAVTAIAAPFAMFRALVPTAALHVWSTGDRPRATDLNGNFSFLNTTKVGGGVQLVNADVSTSAAIAHSKLATPALVPKAWAMVSANCTASASTTACTLGDSSQVTSIAGSGSGGVWDATLAYTPANANFAVLVTSRSTTGVCMADTYSTSTPHFKIRCFDYAGAALDSLQFTVLVMDS